MNPFKNLEPALKSLTNGPKLIPATGQAQEYLQRFDIDEYYDRIETENDKRYRNITETTSKSLYIEVPPLKRNEENLYKYFVDGSVKTFFLGTLIEHERNTPILLAQIGAAAISREDNGQVHVETNNLVKQIILLLNKNQLSESVWNTTEKALYELNSTSKIRLVNTDEEDSYNRSKSFGNNKESRSRAAHKANWEMRLLEKDLLSDLLTKIENDKYIVIDGSLGKEFYDSEFDKGFLGVVKNFSKEQTFQLKKSMDDLSLFELLSKLDVNHRTIAFSRVDGKVAFWYLRIRTQTHLDYPLMGVLKVEYPNPQRETIDSELINHLSRALVAERTVSPHGRDSRWHAHLYPIYLAEQAIKNSFFSDEILQSGLKWPVN